MGVAKPIIRYICSTAFCFILLFSNPINGFLEGCIQESNVYLKCALYEPKYDLLTNENIDEEAVLEGLHKLIRKIDVHEYADETRMFIYSSASAETPILKMYLKDTRTFLNDFDNEVLHDPRFIFTTTKYPTLSAKKYPPSKAKNYPSSKAKKYPSLRGKKYPAFIISWKSEGVEGFFLSGNTVHVRELSDPHESIFMDIFPFIPADKARSSTEFEPKQENQSNKVILRAEPVNDSLIAIFFWVGLILGGLGSIFVQTAKFGSRLVFTTSGKQHYKSGLTKAPGSFLMKIAEFLPKKYATDLIQNVSDMRLEYFDALNENKRVQADSIVILYKLGIFFSSAKWAAGIVKEVLGFIPKSN